MTLGQLKTFNNAPEAGGRLSNIFFLNLKDQNLTPAGKCSCLYRFASICNFKANLVTFFFYFCALKSTLFALVIEKRKSL